MRNCEIVLEFYQKVDDSSYMEGKMKLDYSKIDDIDLDGIDHNDYPDFCDAFICAATYNGREMTDEELDVLNDDRDYGYDKVIARLF